MKNDPIKIEKLIKSGTLYKAAKDPIVSEVHLDNAINHLTTCSKTDPGVLLTELFANYKTHMACVGLAILSAAGPDEFLRDDNVKHAAIDILLSKNPIQLLEFIEYLKSRAFGRGFGSRPQKWVRKVMEGWQYDDLERWLKTCPEEMYDLIRLVHPRYKGERGELVRKLVDKMS